MLPLSLTHTHKHTRSIFFFPRIWSIEFSVAFALFGFIVAFHSEKLRPFCIAHSCLCFHLSHHSSSFRVSPILLLLLLLTQLSVQLSLLLWRLFGFACCFSYWQHIKLCSSILHFNCTQHTAHRTLLNLRFQLLSKTALRFPLSTCSIDYSIVCSLSLALSLVPVEVCCR